MSHKSTPRSPRPKSPNCPEEGETGKSEGLFGSLYDEMGTQLQQQFDSSEGLLRTTSNLVAHTRGSRTQDGCPPRNVSFSRSTSRSPSSCLKDRNSLQVPSFAIRSPSASRSCGINLRTSQRSPTKQLFFDETLDSSVPVSDFESDDCLQDLNQTSYLDMVKNYSSRDQPRSSMNYVNLSMSRQQCPDNRTAIRQTNCPGSKTAGSSPSKCYSTCALNAESYAPARSFAADSSPVTKQQFGYNDANPLNSTWRSDSRRYLNQREDAASVVDKSRVSARSPVPGPSDNLNQMLGQSMEAQEYQVGHGGHRISLSRTKTNQESFTRSPQTPSKGHLHNHQQNDRRVNKEYEQDERAMAALAHLSQLKKTPSYKCGVKQSADLLNVCSPKVDKSKKLPEMPGLETGELVELIRSERQDVESAQYLTSKEKKFYKKPCPKQQKAQMNVVAMVKGQSNQIIGEKYTPLEHPDPEDISPEVAANMMFSQEKGIKMDGCPKEIITHLFPDEVKQSNREKIQRSSISVVDPNQKDREVMMEKSVGVPSEGVSDSAYTRTMKEKGEELVAQKSYDVNFAIGQSKREYVLVAQKPQRFSKVQFRGANLPSWFPGYFCAFPDEDGIKEISSPSELFHRAWVHTNPRNMPANDVIVLD